MRIAALVVLLLLASCGTRRPQDTVKTPVLASEVNTIAEVEALIETYRETHEKVSAEALAPLYSQDLDLILVYQGREHQGWTAVQAFLTGRLQRATKVRMSIKDVSIRQLGPGLAMVSATRDTSTGDGSVTVTEQGMLTLVLQKRDEGWMVVAEHFSYPTGRS